MTRQTGCSLSNLFLSAVLLSGCVVSVDPVLTESEAHFDTSLLGSWEEVGGTDRARISGGSGDTYVIEYSMGGKMGRFEARLGRLGDQRVLDLWPAPDDHDFLEPYNGLLVGGHILLALDTVSEGVRLRMLDPDSLLRALRVGEVPLHHRSREDRLVLHGTTDQLRSSLARYIALPGVLFELSLWRRPGRADASEWLPPVEVPCFEPSPWQEADRLFRGDLHWIGSDVASSVDLGGGRILWLFGDTWIDPSGRGTRQGAAMIRNSVGVQTGSNPATASIEFFWGTSPDGRPEALFQDGDGESLWFGNGVRVEDRLVLFFSRVVRAPGIGLGFDQAGWTAVMVENPDDEPSDWKVHWLDTAPNPMGVLVGFAAAFRLGEYVYALGSANPIKSHPIYAVRWSAEEVRRGDLGDPEWWAGQRVGWVPDTSDVQRWPLFENGQSELSIHFDDATQRFIGVQTQGFPAADVTMRAAPALEGPWSGTQLVFRPPEFYRPNVMIYAAKAHPELTGGDLVLTYATNTTRFGEHLTDSLIYYPRFVRLARCR